MLFTEDAERYVAVSNIVCALTCSKYRKDTLELEEDDLILLLDVLHHTSQVVTVTEAAESVEMTETAVNEVQHKLIPRRRKGSREHVPPLGGARYYRFVEILSCPTYQEESSRLRPLRFSRISQPLPLMVQLRISQ